MVCFSESRSKNPDIRDLGRNFEMPKKLNSKIQTCKLVQNSITKSLKDSFIYQNFNKFTNHVSHSGLVAFGGQNFRLQSCFCDILSMFNGLSSIS